MKVLFDTNVFIAFFRNPMQKEEFEARTQRPLLFMSSVVALELYAGCRTTQQQKALASFLKPFEKAGRVVTPDHASFREAGRILALFGRDGMNLVQRRHIANDVLIAVTSTKVGAVLVTTNEHDFRRIEKYTPLRWIAPG